MHKLPGQALIAIKEIYPGSRAELFYKVLSATFPRSGDVPEVVTSGLKLDEELLKAYAVTACLSDAALVCLNSEEKLLSVVERSESLVEGDDDSLVKGLVALC